MQGALLLPRLLTRRRLPLCNRAGAGRRRGASKRLPLILPSCPFCWHRKGPGEKMERCASRMKREQYLSWDEYFMGIALLSAQRSKGSRHQVGACIVGEDNKILSVG